MKKNSISLLSAILTESWHIHQSSSTTLMPMIFQLLQNNLQSDFDETTVKEGLSPNAERLLQNYQSLNPQPYVNESDSWYYQNIPVKIGSVVVIPIIGVITQEDTWSNAGTKTIMAWYEKAKNDPEVTAIIEIKNTQGGQVFGTRALADYKAKYPKTIIGLCEGMECSAGAYIGSTDDYKFAISTECIIGSCGVMTTFQDWSGYFEKMGIKISDVYSSTSPLKNDSYRKAVKGDFTGYTDGILYKFDESFMAFMQTQRPDISPEALAGADYTTTDAIANGLIDAIGDFQAAYDKALEMAGTKKILKPKTNQMSKTVLMAVPAALAAGLKILGINEVAEPVAGTPAETPPVQTPPAVPIGAGAAAEIPPAAAADPAPVPPIVQATTLMTLEQLTATVLTMNAELTASKGRETALQANYNALQAAAAAGNPAIVRSIARQQGADPNLPETPKEEDGKVEGEDELKAHFRVK